MRRKRYAHTYIQRENRRQRKQRNHSDLLQRLPVNKITDGNTRGVGTVFTCVCTRTSELALMLLRNGGCTMDRYSSCSQSVSTFCRRRCPEIHASRHNPSNPYTRGYDSSTHTHVAISHQSTHTWLCHQPIQKVIMFHMDNPIDALRIPYLTARVEELG